MSSLGKIFQKYSGAIRGWKFVYVLNNLLNRNHLQHNKELYKKYGIEKSIYGNIGSHNFDAKSEKMPWLDQKDAKDQLQNNSEFLSFDESLQKKIIQFIDEGFILMEGFYNKAEVDRLNEEVQGLLENKKAAFNYTQKKIMFAHEESELIDKAYFKNEKLLKLLNFVMGKKVVPFSTINFIEGSEQRAHSDSIHMMTYPYGYLIATWTALESTDEGNGPLVYYPASHKLPYVTCQDYASGNTKLMIGNNSYKKYEDYIEALIESKKLEKKYFHAKPGDVFIWHANLLHGGSPINEEGRTRKSMVSHYFCEGVICYHEISQRPALLKV